MELLYIKVMYRIKHNLWRWWHVRLGYEVFPFAYEDRPWWHMCCNGDYGGWRTDLCDWLEGGKNGWRYLEARLYPWEEEADEIV